MPVQKPPVIRGETPTECFRYARRLLKKHQNTSERAARTNKRYGRKNHAAGRAHGLRYAVEVLTALEEMNQRWF